jgi:uncharacterized coiled-coil protein SlyX
VTPTRTLKTNITTTEDEPRDSFEIRESVGDDNKDGINSYIRKFLFKELDKIRSDYKQSNILLSQNIANNEEFYSKKFEGLKTKLKNDTVTPQNVESMVNAAINKKFAELNLKDENNKNREEVSKSQAQINSLVSHFNSTQDEIRKLKDHFEDLNRKVEILARNSETDKRSNLHKFDTIDKALTDVREDCIANSDSFMVSVESRLENIEHKLRTSEGTQREIKKVPILEQPRVSDPLIQGLRSEIGESLKKLSLRVNSLENQNQAQNKTAKELDNRINSLQLSGKKDIKDLYERLNEMGDQIENTDMTINKKVNMLQNTPVSLVPKSNSDKVFENRILRLETITVRHGKLLDEITTNINFLLNEHSANVVKGNNAPCVCEEYTEDFANKVTQSFESRIRALEFAVKNTNDAEFKEQVFNEIDGIKSAAIEDIKSLDKNVKMLEQDIHHLKHCNSSSYLNYQAPDHSGHRTRSLKRVTFNENIAPKPKEQSDNDTDLDRADNFEVTNIARRSTIPAAATSSGIVLMGSKKSLDSKPVGNISDRSSRSLHSSPHSVSRRQGSTYKASPRSSCQV